MSPGNKPRVPCNWTSADGLGTFGTFLKMGRGSLSIRLALDRAREDLPEGHVPIAEAPFGNLLLVACSKRNRGKIYFWDHEASTNPISLVATSFEEFFRSFRAVEEIEIGEDDFELV